MTLNQFMFFAAIAKHGSLTKASRELRISQPSVSQQLRLLERDYGVKLYRRNGRGIELTEAGRLFLSRVAPILKQVEQIRRIFPRPAARRESVRLKVGGTYNPSTLLLPALAARFKKKHSQVEVELRTVNVPQLEQLVANAQIEIGVSTHPPRHPALVGEPLRREQMVLFVSPSHPLARKSLVTLADLQVFPLVVTWVRNAPGTTVRLLNELADQGVKFKIGMRCESPYAIKEAVKKNAGIGIVFEDLVRREAELGAFKILRGHGLKLLSQSFVLYRADRPLSRAGQEFLGLLRGVRSGRPRANGRIGRADSPAVDHGARSLRWSSRL